MMDDDLDLRDFSNVARIFPLPNLVMFPHVVLPLHIFEPRYRQMTEDALAGDRLITMIQICPRRPGNTGMSRFPSRSWAASAGSSSMNDCSDGRFNFLLLGRKRVRLSKEINTGKLYRMVEVEIMEDVAASPPEDPARGRLLDLFRQLMRTPSRTRCRPGRAPEERGPAGSAVRHHRPYPELALGPETTAPRGNLGGSPDRDPRDGHATGRRHRENPHGRIPRRSASTDAPVRPLDFRPVPTYNTCSRAEVESTLPLRADFGATLLRSRRLKISHPCD